MAEPTIDAATFTELQDTAGPEFVNELVQTFLEEAPALLDELHQARAAGDAQRFVRAAHSLKSNAHTFGAAPLGALARALELKGLGGADEAALQALAGEYARAADALKALAHG